MPDQNTIKLLKLSDGDVGLRSIFKHPDGTPRFVIPLPPDLDDGDLGINYMVINENQLGCEYQTRRFFDAHLDPGDLFIDVGAHWGLFTLTAASRHPDELSVIAIEPDPHNVTRLKKSIEHNKLSTQVEVLPCAVGATVGTANLVGGMGTMGHSIEGVAYAPDEKQHMPPPSCSVPIVTLDHILTERKELTDKPVFLKVDVEGLELEVLAGATGLLESDRLTALVIEKGKTYQNDPALSDFGTMLDSLRARGFQCFRFEGHNHPGPLIPYELSTKDCDVICLSERITPLPHYE